MNRRHLLAALGGAASAGCLTFTESTGTDTPTAASGGDRSGRELVAASTAAEAVETRSWGFRARAVVADDDAYAVVTDIPAVDDSIRLYEYGGYAPRWESSDTVVWETLELTGSAVYAAGRLGDPQEPSIVRRFDRESGDRLAQRRFDDTVDTLVDAGDLLVCTTHEETDDDANPYRVHVHGLDAESLTERWVREFRTQTFPDHGARIGETVHLGFGNFFVGLGVADGTHQYRAPIGVSYSTVYDGDLLADVDGQLRRIDPGTLDYEWSAGSDVLGCPLVVGDIAAVPTTNGVLAARVTDGELLWHREFEDDTSYEPETLGYHEGLLWFGAAEGGLYGLVTRTGETAFSMSVEVGWLESSSSGVVVATSSDLSVYTTERA